MLRSLVRYTKSALDKLPNKVDFELKPLGRLNKQVTSKRVPHVTQSVGSMFGGNHSLKWTSQPRNVLIVKKSDSECSTRAMEEVIAHLRTNYCDTNIIVENGVKEELKASRELYTTTETDEFTLSSKVDFAITLGGDGTALHTASLFPTGPVPPVLSFSTGTLGFLLPFHINSYKSAIDDVLNSNVSVIKRMRLMCTLHDASGGLIDDLDVTHVLNEVALHRGRYPHLVQIEIYVDGMPLTETVADGLIVSTPTGSSAYSLSAGGPLVHPCVQSIVLTPICPRSLSFRPVILPSDSTVQLRMSTKARSKPDVSLDGREVMQLDSDNYIQISMSPFPLPSINRAAIYDPESRQGTPRLPSEKQLAQSALDRLGRAQDDWVRDINDLLNFNSRFESKGQEIYHGGQDD
ncbi:ATP-NAD kinase [Wallemia mellicola CBS 633.66]|uniref:ATP-NAD kinase n=1 Tax=Wallemia mellicola (strain ATCC MYA-4683 / CBS 633.66) TaxID=671144 RepID=I4YAJ9_WALMC|nr:ATP-NAD kinase [Wallemia mellicola CBS 633.66]EIM20991.1 ATP-NAD kinase [Wallemia mellicola CBS 633.66]|eukprot:XP_006958980.1 ATP-NAD kinase [Wallemia mellicola CBS 633.66]